MSRCIHHYVICKRGFSLMELLITMAVMGIVLSIGTFGFNQWLVKSRVEAQVKQMVSDIGELRIRALTTKQRHSITLNATSYVLKSYSSEADTKFKGTDLPGGAREVAYRMKNLSGTDYSGTVLEIDARGMLVSNTATVILDYNGSAAIDCFTLHIIRVNPGKKNAAGDKCNDK